MAEHFGLEQCLGKSGAVDRNQRAARPAAVAMNELRDHFLAAAALAGYEYRGVSGRDTTRQRDSLAEGARRPHSHGIVGASLGAGAQDLCFARDVHGVRRASHEHLQLAAGKRLRQIVPGAGPHRFESGFDGGLAGNDDDDGVRIGCQRGADQLHPGGAAHVQVHEDDVEGVPLQSLERLFTAPAHLHLIAVEPQCRRAAIAQDALVVDNEDAHACLHRAVEGQQMRHVAFGRRSGSPPGGRRRRRNFP